MKLFLGLTLGFTGILYALAIVAGLAFSFIIWGWQPMQAVFEQMFDWTTLRITIATATVCAFSFWLDSKTY